MKPREGQIELELMHATRIALMEQLSASIVHEVNQPIAATILNAEAALRLLGAEAPALDEVRRALGRIVRDAQRAHELISGLRAFMQQTPPDADSLDINDAIREIVALTRDAALTNGVLTGTRLAEGLPPVQGHRVLLQQVILNLIVNAFEAMQAVGPGSRQLLISSARGSDGVLVAIADTGPGLPLERSERLFEASYTTKPGGLGMGLSICRAIIDRHGGRLWATQNLPRGAVFQFALPVGRSPVP